jgi:hypothetical protein
MDDGPLNGEATAQVFMDWRANGHVAPVNRQRTRLRTCRVVNIPKATPFLVIQLLYIPSFSSDILSWHVLPSWCNQSTLGPT